MAPDYLGANVFLPERLRNLETIRPPWRRAVGIGMHVQIHDALQDELRCGGSGTDKKTPNELSDSHIWATKGSLQPLSIRFI